MATRLTEVQVRELLRLLETERGRANATEDRLRRLELEITALRQLIETQTGLLSSLWAAPRIAVGEER